MHCRRDLECCSALLSTGQFNEQWLFHLPDIFLYIDVQQDSSLSRVSLINVGATALQILTQ